MASELGPSLRAARLRAGLTREQLAVKAGLSAATVARAEATVASRQHAPRMDTLEALLAALDLTLADLLKEPAA